MQDELDALHKTGTWDLIPLPFDKHAIGCKWVYRIKTKVVGSLDRYKAHPMAKGYAQEYGVDYDETFAPGARVTSMCTLISIASSLQWPLFQMDVKNAFLNGGLLKEVYIRPPPGLENL